MSELAAGRAAATSAPAEQRVRDAIANAARETQVDFDYLLAQAKVESGLDSEAKARTSSASGLFQFIESTWLATLHRHGDKFGLQDHASKIGVTPRGLRVLDPADRAAVLSLRFDPDAASKMAGALATDNGNALRPILGREPDAGELYLAHFLGAGGASGFLEKLKDDPSHSAASIFPRAAAANRAIFYGRDGSERTLGSVMELIDQKIGTAIASNSAPSQRSYPAARAARIEPTPILGAASAYDRAPSIPSGRRSMSDIIRDSFGSSVDSPRGRTAAHVRDAYAKLEAFGL